MIDWVVINKNWIFSGVGIAAIGFVFKVIFFGNGGNKIKQIQKTGDNCSNYQSARDINIGASDDK